MSCENILSNKPPGANVILCFDFGPELSPGETLTAITSRVVEVIGGVDPNPTALWNGPSAIDFAGQSIQQPVTGGLESCFYGVTMTVDTSAGRRLVLRAILPVNT